MNYFSETAYAFRNQVSQTNIFTASVENALGVIGGMTFEDVAFNILKTPDLEKWDLTLPGPRKVVESIADVFRNNFTFWDGVTWIGIGSTTLYYLITDPQSQVKRPYVTIGDFTYQVHGIADDSQDATVKLTLRRKES